MTAIEDQLERVVNQLRQNWAGGLNPTGHPLPANAVVLRDRERFLTIIGVIPGPDEDKEITWQMDLQGDLATSAWNLAVFDELATPQGTLVVEHGRDAGRVIEQRANSLVECFTPDLERLQLKSDLLMIFETYCQLAVTESLSGMSSALCRTITQVLQAGGIPYGFEHTRKAGDVLVYWPHAEDPVGGRSPQPGGLALGPPKRQPSPFGKAKRRAGAGQPPQ